MSLQIFKQELQCLITSVKADLDMFRSAKSTFLPGDIRKQAARVRLLQPACSTTANPAAFPTTPGTQLHPPALPSPSFADQFEHIQFCTGLQTQLVSFPSNLFLTVPSSLDLPWTVHNLKAWTLSLSLVSREHIKRTGSGLCTQTPNGHILLQAFSLWLLYIIFAPSISSAISLGFF